ncbi:site-specific integrase [Sphingobacterium hotanense]|uniref:Site-specific integrase n=1 Tax=Sphingobacterium hotanense TaxID=649196 RepID=A0ABT7NLJ5_9SPHI|nr:site-specific integrase [Sphingobacterium hotanense]MDM1048021.1 site-specific integrase [Sphingobacterium hotanense]
MKITLKEKKLKSGLISYYIEFYKGSTVGDDGKRIHLRDFEYLKLYFDPYAKTANEKKKNKEDKELAENILAIRKADFAQGKYGIKNPIKAKRRFLDFFLEKSNEKSGSTRDTWISTYAHLQNIISKNFVFEEVNETFCNNVRKYFDKEAKTKSNLFISSNTKYSYFNKFKASLRLALKEGYLNHNFADDLKSFDMVETQREYLTFEELQKLSDTPCKYPVLKSAFIFACLSGLRWSDCNKLTWSEVREEGDDVYKVNFRQEKTEGVEYLYISKQARDLLGKRGEPHERVFKGLKYSATNNNELAKWVLHSGTQRHITFHSARHTNAVLLLENGADLYTVQKRLGHKIIRTTQIYAKIADRKMRESAYIIPELKLNIL